MWIEILNWSKYNPRNDVKHTTWFRLENNFWIDPALTSLDNDGKMVWLVLLSLASQRQCSKIELDKDFISSAIHVTVEKFEASLKHFQDRDKIKIHMLRRRNVHVTPTVTSALRLRNATDGRTDGTDGTDERTTVTSRDSPSESDLAVGSEWLELAVSEMSWRKGTASFTPERFAEGIAKLKRATDLNDDGVRAVLAFIKSDEFWRKNALSPAGLLKRSERNGNRKIDNILLRMKATQDSPISRQAAAAMKWAEGTDGN